MEREFGINLYNYNISLSFKEKVLNNCVQPEMGKFIFNCAFKNLQQTLK